MTREFFQRYFINYCGKNSSYPLSKCCFFFSVGWIIMCISYGEEQGNIVMAFQRTENMTGCPGPVSESRCRKRLSGFFSHDPANNGHHPALVHINSSLLFCLEKDPEKYSHLLKKKDKDYVGPLINYLIGKSGNVVYLGGDAVRNLYLQGKKRYRSLNILAVISEDDLDRCSCMMNNIISSNDGAFSMGFRYRVNKNRQDGCFKGISQARYIIEPRLEGPEKLLYPFRASTIELDLISPLRFSNAFGIEAR